MQSFFKHKIMRIKSIEFWIHYKIETHSQIWMYDHPIHLRSCSFIICSEMLYCLQFTLFQLNICITFIYLPSKAHVRNKVRLYSDRHYTAQPLRNTFCDHKNVPLFVCICKWLLKNPILSLINWYKYIHLKKRSLQVQR